MNSKEGEGDGDGEGDSLLTTKITREDKKEEDAARTKLYEALPYPYNKTNIQNKIETVKNIVKKWGNNQNVLDRELIYDCIHNGFSPELIKELLNATIIDVNYKKPLMHAIEKFNMDGFNLLLESPKTKIEGAFEYLLKCMKFWLKRKEEIKKDLNVGEMNDVDSKIEILKKMAVKLTEKLAEKLAEKSGGKRKKTIRKRKNNTRRFSRRFSRKDRK